MDYYFYDTRSAQKHLALPRILTVILIVILVLVIICVFFCGQMDNSLAFGKFTSVTTTPKDPAVVLIPARPSETPIYFSEVVSKNSNTDLTSRPYKLCFNSSSADTYWKVYCELVISPYTSNDLGTEVFKLYTETDDSVPIVTEAYSLTLSLYKQKGYLERVITVAANHQLCIFVGWLASGKSYSRGTIEVQQL